MDDSQLDDGPQSRHAKTWRDHLSTIFDWWLLAAFLGVLVAALFVYLKLQEVPLYKSSSVLLFEPPTGGGALTGIGYGGGGANAWEATLANKMTDLHSGEFFALVLDSFSKAEKDILLRGYENEDVKPDIPAVIRSGNNIHRRGANIFVLEFHHRDPAAAALLANRYAELYGDFELRRKQEQSDAAVRFLRRQSEELRLRVERGELALQKFRQDRDLVSLEENQNLILERMKTVSASLNSEKLALLDLESNLNKVLEMQKAGEEIWNHPAIRGYGGVSEKLEQLNQLRLERKLLSERYGRRHPKMQQNEASVQAVQQELGVSANQALVYLQTQVNNRRNSVANLEETLKKAEQDSLALGEVSIEYNILRRKLASDEALFQEMLARLNDAQIAGELVNTNVRVIDRGSTPFMPFTPDRKKIFTTAAVLFLGIFIGLPFVMDFLIGKLKARWQVEYALQLRYLGSVRRIRFATRHRLHELVRTNKIPQVTEQFRSIFSHISLRLMSDQPLTLAVASLGPREGKTMVTANLGATYTKHRHKVILIDCDLRRPGLSGAFEKQSNPGVIQFVEAVEKGRQVSPDEVILSVGENLDMIPTGGATEEATEILHSEAFSSLIRQMQERYDLVLIDTPPLSLFPDSLSLAPLVDGYILLSRHKGHRVPEVKEAIKRIYEAKAEIVGFIFTMAKQSRRNRYYTGEYRYNYGPYAKGKKSAQPAVNAPALGVPKDEQQPVESAR